MIKQLEQKAGFLADAPFNLQGFIESRPDDEVKKPLNLLIPSLKSKDVKLLYQLVEEVYKSGFKDALKVNKSEIKSFSEPEKKKTITVDKIPVVHVTSNTKIIERIHSTLSVTIANAKSGCGTLPIFPKVAQKVLHLLEDSNLTIKKMTRELTYDQGISSKLISKANSVYYGLLYKADNLEKAIVKIGLNEVKQMLYLYATKEIYQINNPVLNQMCKNLANHAAASGNIAYNLARLRKLPSPSNFLIKALFHDVGKLWLIIVISKALGNEKDLYTAIDKKIIFDAFDRLHTKLGAFLLSKWNFDDNIVQSVANHHSEPSKGNIENCIIQFADLFSKELGHSVRENEKETVKLLRIKDLLDIKNFELETLTNELRASLTKHLI